MDAILAEILRGAGAASIPTLVLIWVIQRQARRITELEAFILGVFREAKKP